MANVFLSLLTPDALLRSTEHTILSVYHILLRLPSPHSMAPQRTVRLESDSEAWNIEIIFNVNIIYLQWLGSET